MSDGEIVCAVRLQALSAPCEELCEEVRVKHQQALQAGEQHMHDPRLQLHLLQHAPPEHAIHDPQRPNVMDLRLDQL